MGGGGQQKIVYQIIMCIHERMSVYDPALQIPAPSMFTVWLRACCLTAVFNPLNPELIPIC